MTIHSDTGHIQPEKRDLSFRLTMEKQKDILLVKAEGERSFKIS
ncbi:MAG: hypothetical protein ACYTFW_21960 [Planctomycetota bacterium]|jgi:hypothetical protein